MFLTSSSLLYSNVTLQTQNWLGFVFFNFSDFTSAVLSFIFIFFFTSLYVKGKGIPLQHIKLTKGNNFASGKADV